MSVKTAGMDADTNKGAAIGVALQECVAGLDGLEMVATEQWEINYIMCASKGQVVLVSLQNATQVVKYFIILNVFFQDNI